MMVATDAEDIQAIVELLNGFARVLDDRAWHRFGDFFTVDGTGYGAPSPGAEAIAHEVRKYLGGCGPSQHMLSNFDVNIDGDTAKVRSSIRAVHLGRDELASVSYEAIGDYRDELERTADGWRMSDRVIDIRIELGDRSVLRPG